MEGKVNKYAERALHRLKSILPCRRVRVFVYDETSSSSKNYLDDEDRLRIKIEKVKSCPHDPFILHKCINMENHLCAKLQFELNNFHGLIMIEPEDLSATWNESEIKEILEEISWIIESDILRQITKKQNALIQTFTEIMKLFQEKLSFEIFTKKLLEKTKNLFDASTVMLSRVDEKRQLIEIVDWIGIKPLTRQVEWGKGAMGRAAATKRPCILEEYPPDLLPSACMNKKGIIASAIAIPITVNGELYGTISFCRTMDQPRFTLADLNILENFQHLLNFTFSFYEYLREKEAFDRIKLRAQKLESLGILAGGIAHDFNNLLNVIMGFTQLCIERARNDPELLEYLNIIFKECQKASNLTSSLLLFSRESTSEKQIVDLKPMVKEFVKLISHTLPENIRVELEINDERPLTVEASPEEIHSILMNLTTNAQDAMPEGGTLKIRLYTKRFSPESPYPEDAVVIEVKDTGCGIPEEHIEKIFDPFFTTKGDKGTGFGLYYTFNVIKGLNGIIDVESTPGKGTTFKIYLPRCEPPEASSPAPDAEPTSYPKLKLKGKVIVVEDNQPLLTAVMEMLKNLNIVSEGFSDPVQALAEFEKKPAEYELLITDLVMPNMGGFELADKMRSINPSLKVIYMTGYTDRLSQLLSRSSEKGTGVLIKPFTIFELGKAIRNLTQ